jgi:hypothetical protein
MIYIPSLINIGWGIQRLGGGGEFTDGTEIAKAYFHFFKIRYVSLFSVCTQ